MKFGLATLILATATAAGCTSPRVTRPAVPQPARAGAPGASRCLRLTYVANEGVLLEGPEGRVLIDALHRPYQPPYPVLPPQLRERAEKAEGIFAGVDLILVSHRHLDHFHPRAVARFLAHSRRARLISSSQVVSAVRQASGKRPPPWLDRTEAVPGTPGARTVRHIGALEVTLVGMRHARPEHRHIHNLAHVIRLGGMKVLHVGDADRARRNFARLQLRPGEVDVALLPYWYFLSRSGRALIDEVLRPRFLVAFHLPPPGARQTRWVRRIRRRYPRVIALTRLLSTWTPPGCRGTGSSRHGSDAPP